MINLENAVVYDIEVLPNVFTLVAEMLNSTVSSVWEISEFKDDRYELLKWFDWLNRTQTPMIGFNNEYYDYPVIHAIAKNPNISFQEIYQKSMSIINSRNRFENAVWQNERFAPQIDLFKIHHFDNIAKSTSLKALEINMRSDNVVDVLGTEIPFDQPLTNHQTDSILKPYNKHDVKETKKFTFYSMPAIEFRISLLGKIPGDVLNFNDTKIGAKTLEQRLGDDICYTRNGYKKTPRQTFRGKIALSEIIFPYVYFENPEFQRVLEYMKNQTLVSDDIENPEATIKTKGVFSSLKAVVGGMEFHFGTGGIHGSIPAQKITATDEILIRDIDVKSLYPSIAVVNNLAPEHLGEAFSKEYASLLTERAKHKKGTVENASLKLAANGTYGNSNSKFSVFYDPKFTMTITINGQLMLCMLAEQLERIPSFRFIQINTDGITYQIHRNYEPEAKVICEAWEKYTLLKLEDVDYSRMWIRDVNNYIAEPLIIEKTNEPLKLKQKGAYWHPDPLNYAESISKAGPPAWHKDFNPTVVTRAAVAAMTQGIDPMAFIKMQHDPFEFMLRVKIPKSSKLMLGDREIQGTTRYYIAKDGFELKKISPPTKGNEIGQFKRANKLTDQFYNSVMNEIDAGVWDERIHTKNKSKYEMRTMNINAGFKIMECNRASDFNFANVNYEWYLNETMKLIIN